MRTQHIVIFFVVFAIFVSAIVWRVDQLMFGDRLNWSEAQARSQMSAIVQSLETETRSFSDLLSLGYPEVEISKKEFSKDKAYGKFEMMAKLLPPNLQQDSRDWQIASQFFREKSSAKTWAANYIRVILHSVKEDEVKPGAANIYSLMDPSRKSYLLILFRGEGNWYAGLMDSTALQSTMDRQKGQMSSVFVVNQAGQTLGHTVREYVGSLLSEDPIVSELMHSSVGSGSGIFKNLKGQSVQGFYEQVGMTNFFVVITTPVSMLTESRAGIVFQLIIMGLGLALIGLAAFVYFYKPEMRKTAAKVLSAAATVIKEKTEPAMKVLAPAKAESSLETAAEKTPAMSVPSAAVVRAPIEKRKSTPLVITKSGINGALDAALLGVQEKMQNFKVELISDIQTIPEFKVSTDLMARALENILLNAIEAMEYSPLKKLTVHLSEKNKKIQLIISDTGVGMDSATVEKAFEPFFTTKHGSHVGMGLSLASGILKGSFGEIEMTSKPAGGTSFAVTFTMPAETSVALPAAGASAFESKPVVTVDPSLDSIIDDFDSEPLVKSKTAAQDDFFHQSLAFEASALKPEGKKSPGKIDKPSIDFKRKVAKIDELEVSVRRPGDHL